MEKRQPKKHLLFCVKRKANHSLSETLGNISLVYLNQPIVIEDKDIIKAVTKKRTRPEKSQLNALTAPDEKTTMFADNFLEDGF